MKLVALTGEKLGKFFRVEFGVQDSLFWGRKNERKLVVEVATRRCESSKYCVFCDL